MTHLQDNNVQAQLDAEAFRRDLTALIPKMRAYARSMCGRDTSEGDDLAQEALLKAWLGRRSYTPGTNLKAWVFMILRNQFYSDKRRSWRQQQLDQETAEATLVAIDNPMDAIELDELRRAIAMLPDEQREALILIGAGGFSYEEVAEMCGAATGTVKSRVSRARDRLALILAEGSYGEDAIRPSGAMHNLLSQLSHLTPAIAA
jgi:RNA polymerase sigma-70 factor (ECF subfamily)